MDRKLIFIVLLLGQTTVTWTVTDYAGNSATATQVVTVEDTEDPVLNNVPGDITIAANAANCEATVTWTAPTGADNCTVSPTVTSTHNSGDAFPQGTTAVTYTVTDDTGNSATASFNVIVTTDLTATASITSKYNGSEVSCNGATDGGTGSYTFLWDDTNASTTQDLSGLAAGTHNVTITDDNGCTGTASGTITEPDPLSSTSVVTDETNGNDGAIDLTVAGGTSPFSISWTGPNGFTSTDEDISNLEVGTYEVTITDASGCTTTETNVVASFVGLSEQEAINFNVYPNPTEGHITLSSSVEGSVEVVNTNGQIVLIANIARGTTSVDLNHLAAGVYWIKLNSTSTTKIKKLILK